MTEQSALIDQIAERCKDALFTGILRVRSGPGDGELWFLSGIVEQVRFGVSTGDEAMDRLKKLTDARVEVVPRLPNEAGSLGKKGYPLEGSLADHQPVELLNFCETQAITCTIELASKGVKGSATYKLGELISIDSDVGTDRAVAEMLEWSDGTFRFQLPTVELPEGVTRIETTATALSSTPPPAKTDEVQAPAAERKPDEAERAAAAKRKAEEEAQRRKAEEERAAARRREEEARAKAAQARRTGAPDEVRSRGFEEAPRKGAAASRSTPPRASDRPAAAASGRPAGAVSDAPKAATVSDAPKAAAVSDAPKAAAKAPTDERAVPKRMGEEERRRAAEQLKKKAQEVMRRKEAEAEARRAGKDAKAFFSDSLEKRKPASTRPEHMEKAFDDRPAEEVLAEVTAKRGADDKKPEAAKAVAEAADVKAKAETTAAKTEAKAEPARKAELVAADAAPDSTGDREKRARKRKTSDRPPAPKPQAISVPPPKAGTPAWIWAVVVVVALIAVYFLALRK